MAPEGYQDFYPTAAQPCHVNLRRRGCRAAVGEQLRWRVAWEFVEDAIQRRHVPGRGRRIRGDGREHRAVRLEVGGDTRHGDWVLFVHVVSPTVPMSTRASLGKPGGSSIGQDIGSGSPRRSASSRRRKSRAKPDSRSSRVSQRAHSARTSARRSSSVRVAVSSIVMLPLVSPRGSPRGVSIALSGWCLAAAAPSRGWTRRTSAPAAPERLFPGGHMTRAVIAATAPPSTTMRQDVSATHVM